MATTTAKKTTSRRSTKTAPESASKLTLTLQKVRETKNTVRFESDDEDAAVTTLYVAKGFVDGDTESITLTLEK